MGLPLKSEPVPGYPGHPDFPFCAITPGGESLYPKWIPCTKCRQALEYHTEKQCPFDSTEFSPSEATVDLILAEMRREGRKSYADDKSWGYGTSSPQKATREDSVRRYFLAFEVVVDKLVARIQFLEEPK